MSLRLGLAYLLTTVLVATAWQPLAAQQAPRERKLAPGVLTVIQPEPQEGETFQGPQPLVEVVVGMPSIAWKPPSFPDSAPYFIPRTQTLLAMAEQSILRREIWNLEFAFKPLRMIEVDIPQPTGKMRRKLIWYMVYRVRYQGYDIVPSPQEDRFGHKTYATEAVNYDARRFFPHFVLASHEFGKSYLDRIIPAAEAPIAERERPGRELYNSVEISSQPIRISDSRTDHSVWGVATWEDVDPRIDYLSVYIQGLTNAYLFVDPPGAFKAGDPPGTGRQFAQKTLQLNFWRPGDTEMEHEEEIRYGVPIDSDAQVQQEILQKFGLKERLDHLWVYR